MGLNWLFESSPAAKWKKLREHPFVFIFIQLYLVYVFGLLYADNSHQAGFELEKKLTVLLFPLIIFTSAPLSAEQLRRIFKIFIVSCLLASIVCYGYAVYMNYQEGQTLSYLFNAVVYDIHSPTMHPYLNYWYFTYELFAKPIDMHPIYLAMYLIFSCCLTIWLYKDHQRKSRKKAVLLGLFLLYNFVTVVLLSSRTQLFILLVLITVFVIYLSYTRKKMLLGIGSLVVVYAIGLVFILSNPFTRERLLQAIKPGMHFSENQFGEGGLSLRTYKWKYALETIKQHPLIGTGTGDSQDELQKTYARHDFKIGYEQRFNAHNQFLQVMLEVGLIGLLSFLICLGGAFYVAWKNKQILYLVFTTIFTISCFTESMLEVNKGIIFYAFFNAVLAASLAAGKARETTQGVA